VDFSIKVTAPKALTVITPGKLDSLTEEDGNRIWSLSGAAPSPHLALFAGVYTQKSFRVGATEVEIYFSPRHREYTEQTNLPGYFEQILSHYQEVMGPYPFFDMPFKVVETSVYKPGGHSSLNVVTLAEYIFNKSEIGSEKVASFCFRDLNIIAHEFAHQWWGSGIRFKENGEWTSEGLTEYTAYKWLQARFAPNLSSSIAKGWELSLRKHKQHYLVKDTQALERASEEIRKKRARQTAQLRAYNVMPLKIIKAEEKLGTVVFANKLKDIYKNYRGTTLSYDNFLTSINLTRDDLEIE